MTGMYQCRDIVFPGLFISGIRGPRKFVRGHIVSGHPIIPPGILRGVIPDFVQLCPVVENVVPLLLTDPRVVLGVVIHQEYPEGQPYETSCSLQGHQLWKTMSTYPPKKGRKAKCEKRARNQINQKMVRLCQRELKWLIG